MEDSLYVKINLWLRVVSKVPVNVPVTVSMER